MFVKVFRNDIIDGLQKSSGIIPAKTGAAFLRTIWLEAKRRLADILHGFQPGVHGRISGPGRGGRACRGAGQKFPRTHPQASSRRNRHAPGRGLGKPAHHPGQPQVQAAHQRQELVSELLPLSRERGGGLVRGFPSGAHRPGGLLHKRRGHHAGHGLHVFQARRRGIQGRGLRPKRPSVRHVRVSQRRRAGHASPRGHPDPEKIRHRTQKMAHGR